MGDRMLSHCSATGVSVFEDTSHCQDAFQRLFMLYKNQNLCDVTLKVAGTSLLCHRVVLACCSKYFHAMFCTEMAEKSRSVIHINDIGEQAMVALVEFAYTAKIALTVDNVQSVFYAASVLQLDAVCNACCQYMMTNLHPENCLGVRAFAERHQHYELIRAADQYAIDFFPDVTKSVEFTNVTGAHLLEIIASDELNIVTESVVYEAVMKWINFDLKARKDFLPVLMAKVRLPLIPAGYLVNYVAEDELLKSCLTCRDFVDEAKYFHMSLTGLVSTPRRSERTTCRKSFAGTIFVVGGRGASVEPLRSVECYDLRRDKWVNVPDIGSRRRHVGIAAAMGKIYAIGGHNGREHLNSAEVLDPRSGKWMKLSPMASRRRGLAVACLGGPLYAIGGLDDRSCFGAVERYDPQSDTWSFVASMNIPRGGVGVAVLKGHLYACGGNDNSASLDSCERYDPHLNKWTLVARMNRRRAGAGATTLNEHIYVLGGWDDKVPQASVERYDPSANKWTEVAPMSMPRGGVGVTTLGGRVLAVAGHNGEAYVNSGEAYDPETDRWESIANMRTGRAGAGIASCDILFNEVVTSSFAEETMTRQRTLRHHTSAASLT